MGFFKQEHWSGFSFLPPGDLPYAGIKPTSPVSLALQVDSLPSEPSGKHTKSSVHVNFTRVNFSAAADQLLLMWLSSLLLPICGTLLKL